MQPQKNWAQLECETRCHRYCRLATNLITYMRTEMLEEPAFAAIMVQLFEGTCYLTPLLGAWLADSRWGRYKTILVFSSIYVLVSARGNS